MSHFSKSLNSQNFPGRVLQAGLFLFVILSVVLFIMGRGTFLAGVCLGTCWTTIVHIQFTMMSRRIFDEGIRQAMKKNDPLEMEKMMFMTTEMLRARFRSAHIDADKN